MRAALWLVALFGVAVAVALFAGNNQAVVTVFWPPHRLDVSFNLMVLVLAGFFMLLYGALRAMSALFALPLEARRWRAQQKERAMYGSLMDSLANLLAGRYIRATKSAQNALVQEKSLGLLTDQSGHVTGHSASRSTQLRSLAHLLVAGAGGRRDQGRPGGRLQRRERSESHQPRHQHGRRFRHHLQGLRY